METMCSSETTVDFHWTTRRYVPEATAVGVSDRTLEILCLKNTDGAVSPFALHGIKKERKKEKTYTELHGFLHSTVELKPIAT
jgi:hypothetical protein